MRNKKPIIYQVIPRLFGNDNNYCVNNGSLEKNKTGKMNHFTKRILEEIKKLGITHMWYTGVIEHATQTDYSKYGIKRCHPAVVKGIAGSPYAITDYYDIDPDIAVDVDNRMKEFENLVHRTHRCQMKVIIDFIPNHVAREYHSDAKPKGVKNLGEDDDITTAFSTKNNFYYLPEQEFRGQFDMWAGADEPYHEIPAKVTGNNCFEPNPNIKDWYETVKLNYGIDYQKGEKRCFDPIPDTWNKMRDILLFWAAKDVDGFRCDMAEMVPIEFWEWVVPIIKKQYPKIIFIGEVYNTGEYRNFIERGEFDYLYDKEGLYTVLRKIVMGYESATAITGAWQSLGGLEKKMLNFLENHDEQRIASDFFAANPYKAIPALIVSACMNTNPMMIYFGQELGEMGMDCEGFSGKDGRTTIFDYWSVDTIRRYRNRGRLDGKMLSEESVDLLKLYRHILSLCNKEKAISNGLFFDLMYVNINGWRFNEHRQYTFMRKYKNELLFIIVNFDPHPVQVAINLPSHAFDYLQIPQQEKYEAKDLITGKKEIISLLPYKATDVEVGGNTGKILKIHL